MKPKLAFDTAALVSLGHTDLIKHISSTYDIIVTQTILDELNDISQFNDDDAIAAKKWIAISKRFIVKPAKKMKHGEDELFIICTQEKIDLVSDDIKAVKKFKKDVDCYFSVHIVYALYARNVITKPKAIIEITKMKHERSWKQNAISIAARVLFL